MKSFRLFIKAVLLLVNILVVIFLVIGAYSDFVSPEKSLTVAYIGLAFPIFCLLNLLFIIYWLFSKSWKFLLLGLIAFGICIGPIKRYFPRNGKTDPVPQENVIKVLTYNVMNFANKRHTPLSPNKIVQYIADSKADIVCLQEYAVAKSEKELNSKVLDQALVMYPYKSVIKLNSSNYWSTGIAVYSKYPIKKSRKIEYESQYNGSAIHELDVNGKKVVLVNNHLESFRLTQKDKSQYTGLIKSMDSDALGNIRGTFQQKLGPAFLTRAEQARLIASEIERVKADYTIVCGDFNDTPISYAHRIIQGDLKDAFEESGSGMGTTYNQNMFLFRIDNIMHSSNIKAYNCTIDKVKYSDHYPMWCFLQLN